MNLYQYHTDCLVAPHNPKCLPSTIVNLRLTIADGAFCSVLWRSVGRSAPLWYIARGVIVLTAQITTRGKVSEFRTQKRGGITTLIPNKKNYAIIKKATRCANSRRHEQTIGSGLIGGLYHRSSLPLTIREDYLCP